MLATVIIGVIFWLLFVLLNAYNNGHGIGAFFHLKKDLKKAGNKRNSKMKHEGACTLLGTSGKQQVVTPNDMRHMFICGTTGSGKTVAISNYIKSAIENEYPLFIIDGKGDTGTGSILDVTKKMVNGTDKKLYVIDLNHSATNCKYNPFKNTSITVCKDMLINMSTWSEEHYKLSAEHYIQRVLTMMEKAKITFSFHNILSYLAIASFQGLSNELTKSEKISKADHISNIELSKTVGKVVEGSISRFSTLAESDLGSVLGDTGINIYDALQENAIILFILNPLLYPELSPSFGNLVVIDSKQAVSKLFDHPFPRTFFIFDEINVYASSSFLNLINKSRSANVTCILATQSLSDLEAVENEAFKEQVIENCNNYLVMRQNSGKNAEAWATIIGTRPSMSVTYQITEEQQGQKGSVRSTREFVCHPDEIKSLSMGEGFFISKDHNLRIKVKVNKPF